MDFTTIISYCVSGFGNEIWHLTDKKREKGKDTKVKKTERPKALPCLEVPAGGYSTKNRQKCLKRSTLVNIRRKALGHLMKFTQG